MIEIVRYVRGIHVAIGRIPTRWRRSTTGYGAARDRFHRKQRRGLMALRLNHDLKQIKRNVAKREALP